MFYYIQSLLIILLEVLCCIFFFHNFGEKKEENSRYRDYLIIGGMSVGLYVLAAGLANHFLLKQIVVILFIIIMMKPYCRLRWGKSVVLSVLF